MPTTDVFRFLLIMFNQRRGQPCTPLHLQDKLMTVTPESEGSSGDNVHWIFKNKDHGKASATASLVRFFHALTRVLLPSAPDCVVA